MKKGLSTLEFVFLIALALFLVSAGITYLTSVDKAAREKLGDGRTTLPQ